MRNGGQGIRLTSSRLCAHYLRQSLVLIFCERSDLDGRHGPDSIDCALRPI